MVAAFHGRTRLVGCVATVLLATVIGCGDSVDLRIVAPEDGARIPEGQSFYLQAEINSSVQLLNVEPEDWQWFSDRDGALGAGALRLEDDLSPGRHELRVEVMVVKRNSPTSAFEGELLIYRVSIDIVDEPNS